ncbi:MAG: adenosine deaminase [Acidobacteriia bacterium]|nr:adenosine deaminase [Terriglobia bacterium]
MDADPRSVSQSFGLSVDPLAERPPDRSTEGPAKPSTFIQSLPKSELHLHLEGSIGPDELGELIVRHGGGPVDRARLAQLYKHRDFTAFLDAFKRVTQWLRTPEDYELITYRLMQKLKAENVLHAEVYVSVGVILYRNRDFDAIFEGLERGRQRGERDFGVSLLWIFDAVRHFGVEAAEKVFNKAVQLRERNVVAIGIGGDERLAAPELFRDLYARARNNGLHLTAHAGESSGPQSIFGALDALKAERIGHGLTAWQDRELMTRLAETQVPIEICLTSNLRTGCCAAAERHPLKTYYDRGIMVTLNTDDPAMFETSLCREYQLAQATFGFSDEQLRELAMNSFRASFLPKERKRELLLNF